MLTSADRADDLSHGNHNKQGNDVNFSDGQGNGNDSCGSLEQVMEDGNVKVGPKKGRFLCVDARTLRPQSRTYSIKAIGYSTAVFF